MGMEFGLLTVAASKIYTISIACVLELTNMSDAEDKNQRPLFSLLLTGQTVAALDLKLLQTLRRRWGKNFDDKSEHLFIAPVGPVNVAHALSLHLGL